MLAKGPLLWLLGSRSRPWDAASQGREKSCAGDGTQPPHPGSGFTFRSVLRIQMKVQTLALLGHFRTMNPPGPFSPLRGKAKRVKAKAGWNSGWDSPWLWDAPHGAEPGSEGQSPVGQEQMLGAREGVCLGSRHTSQHGRAAFPQVPWQQRCQGRRWSSSSASGSCQLFPTGTFHQAQPWVQTRGPRKLCVLRTGLALVTAAPRYFPEIGRAHV